MADQPLPSQSPHPEQPNSVFALTDLDFDMSDLFDDNPLDLSSESDTEIGGDKTVRKINFLEVDSFAPVEMLFQSSNSTLAASQPHISSPNAHSEDAIVVNPSSPSSQPRQLPQSPNMNMMTSQPMSRFLFTVRSPERGTMKNLNKQRSQARPSMFPHASRSPLAHKAPMVSARVSATHSPPVVSSLRCVKSSLSPSERAISRSLAPSPRAAKAPCLMTAEKPVLASESSPAASRDLGSPLQVPTPSQQTPTKTSMLPPPPPLETAANDLFDSFINVGMCSAPFGSKTSFSSSSSFTSPEKTSMLLAKSAGSSFTEPSTPGLVDSRPASIEERVDSSHTYPIVIDSNTGQPHSRTQLDDIRRVTDPNFLDNANWGDGYYFSRQVRQVPPAEDNTKFYKLDDHVTTFRALRSQASEKFPLPDLRTVQVHTVSQVLKDHYEPSEREVTAKADADLARHIQEVSPHFSSTGQFVPWVQESGQRIEEGKLRGLNMQSMVLSPQVVAREHELRAFCAGAVFARRRRGAAQPHRKDTESLLEFATLKAVPKQPEQQWLGYTEQIEEWPLDETPSGGNDSDRLVGTGPGTKCFKVFDTSIAVENPSTPPPPLNQLSARRRGCGPGLTDSMPAPLRKSAILSPPQGRKPRVIASVDEQLNASKSMRPPPRPETPPNLVFGSRPGSTTPRTPISHAKTPWANLRMGMNTTAGLQSPSQRPMRVPMSPRQIMLAQLANVQAQQQISQTAGMQQISPQEAYQRTMQVGGISSAAEQTPRGVAFQQWTHAGGRPQLTPDLITRFVDDQQQQQQMRKAHRMLQRSLQMGRVQAQQRPMQYGGSPIGSPMARSLSPQQMMQLGCPSPMHSRQMAGSPGRNNIGVVPHHSTSTMSSPMAQSLPQQQQQRTPPAPGSPMQGQTARSPSQNYTQMMPPATASSFACRPPVTQLSHQQMEELINGRHPQAGQPVVGATFLSNLTQTTNIDGMPMIRPGTVLSNQSSDTRASQAGPSQRQQVQAQSSGIPSPNPNPNHFSFVPGQSTNHLRQTNIGGYGSLHPLGELPGGLDSQPITPFQTFAAPAHQPQNLPTGQQILEDPSGLVLSPVLRCQNPPVPTGRIHEDFFAEVLSRTGIWPEDQSFEAMMGRDGLYH